MFLHPLFRKHSRALRVSNRVVTSDCLNFEPHQGDRIYLFDLYHYNSKKKKNCPHQFSIQYFFLHRRSITLSKFSLAWRMDGLWDTATMMHPLSQVRRKLCKTWATGSISTWTETCSGSSPCNKLLIWTLCNHNVFLFYTVELLLAYACYVF